MLRWSQFNSFFIHINYNESTQGQTAAREETPNITSKIDLIIRGRSANSSKDKSFQCLRHVWYRSTYQGADDSEE